MEKKFQIILTEEKYSQLENIIGEIPVKWGVPLLNLLNQNLKEEYINKDSEKILDKIEK